MVWCHYRHKLLGFLLQNLFCSNFPQPVEAIFAFLSHFADLFFGINETILRLMLLGRSDKIPEKRPSGTRFTLTSFSEEYRPSQSILWGKKANGSRKGLVTLHQQSGSRDRKWVYSVSHDPFLPVRFLVPKGFTYS